MTKDDFAAYGIRYFKPAEITATGAKLIDVKARLIQHLDKFRAEMCCPIKLIKNGLTTGTHSSTEHKSGLAADITMTEINPMSVFCAALDSGFKGIGLYYHYGKWVSVHLDLRLEFAFWRGIKTGNQKKWTYLPLVEEHPE